MTDRESSCDPANSADAARNRRDWGRRDEQDFLDVRHSIRSKSAVRLGQLSRGFATRPHVVHAACMPLPSASLLPKVSNSRGDRYRRSLSMNVDIA
jgi:hypothetical protein